MDCKERGSHARGVYPTCIHRAMKKNYNEAQEKIERDITGKSPK